MKRLAADVLTVLCVLGLAVVATLWVRSYFFPDIIDSYHDVPAPEPGEGVEWGSRPGWRERAVLSFPGRFEFVSMDTVILSRGYGPTSRPSSQPSIPNGSMGNGWWFYPRRSWDWRPSNAPPPPSMWHGFAIWSADVSGELYLAHADYREMRQRKAWGMAAPYWVPAAVLAVVPALRALHTLRRRKRYRSGDGSIGHGVYRLSLALSLVLLTGTTAGWVRSHSVCHMLRRETGGEGPIPEKGPARLWHGGLTVYSKQGAISVYRNYSHPGGDGRPTVNPVRYDVYYGSLNQFILRPSGGKVWVDRLGFHLSSEQRSPPATDGGAPARSIEWATTVPYWVVAAVFAVLPAVAALRSLQAYRRRRRAAGGLCARCGYDLRASADRCPECGSPAELPPSADD